MSDARLENRGSAGDAGADAGLEVTADAGRDGCGAPVGLEAVKVEAEALDSLPEMRIIDMATVLVERVDHLEEAALQARGLGCSVQGR